MQIAVAATPGVAIPTLDWLISSKHELDFVISRPDRPAGRGKKVRASEVSNWADSHGVEIFKPLGLGDMATVAKPLNSVELLITIGFGMILPPNLYRIPRYGAINLHFSLLPAWRGAAPVQRAIEAGDSLGGVSVFALDEGMDTGPIYVQHSSPFSLIQSAGEILAGLSQLGARAVAETLELIVAAVEPIPQSTKGASRARKVSKVDAHIDWTRSAISIERQIRAFTPEPGAWSSWRENQIQISKARVVEDALRLTYGEILVRQGSIFVGCGSGGALEILEITPAGKKLMTTQSWVNGARLGIGEKFV